VGRASVRKGGFCRGLHARCQVPNPEGVSGGIDRILGQGGRSIVNVTPMVFPRAYDDGEGRPHGRGARGEGTEAGGKGERVARGREGDHILALQGGENGDGGAQAEAKAICRKVSSAKRRMLTVAGNVQCWT
jgi:hypothetical protein